MKNSIIIFFIFLIISEIIYSFLKKKDILKSQFIIYISSLIIGPLLNIIYNSFKGIDDFIICFKNGVLFVILINLIYLNIIFFKKRMKDNKNSFKNMKKDFKENYEEFKKQTNKKK